MGHLETSQCLNVPSEPKRAKNGTFMSDTFPIRGPPEAGLSGRSLSFFVLDQYLQVDNRIYYHAPGLQVSLYDQLT